MKYMHANNNKLNLYYNLFYYVIIYYINLFIMYYFNLRITAIIILHSYLCLVKKLATMDQGVNLYELHDVTF